jgi:S-adenosylmethionine:tRNA ribosyltransferase-isomerase
MIVPATGEPRDATFRAFPEVLRSDDVLVINETRVVRARLRGERDHGGGAVAVLLLRPADGTRWDERATRWLALVRPGKRLRAGAVIRFGTSATATIADVLPDGPRVVAFDLAVPFGELLERHGEVPLPPYVGAREDDEARARAYQTVFAKVPGSVAAPTASLHFTDDVFAAIRARGTTIVPLVLDVGIGTFRPMGGVAIDEHVMHAEAYEIPEATARVLRDARAAGRRVVAAGTTVLRALEGAAAQHAGIVPAGPGETSLFVTPGFAFRAVDALLTNFHLPKSTLLVLVSAFAGYDRTRRAYERAVARGYRFYSFGDAMFVERAESDRS